MLITDIKYFISNLQRRIQNPAELLRWSFLAEIVKQLKVVNYYRRKVPS